MKTFKTRLFLTMLFLSAGATATPGDITVLKNLYQRTLDVQFKMIEENYIWNIQGYACPWPAIDIEEYKIYGVKLKHAMAGGFMVKGLGLAIEDPNRRFCSVGGVEEVFGESWKEGEEILLPITVTRQVVAIENHNGAKRKFLRERIDTMLGQRKLYSEALVSLEADQL